MVIGMEKKMFGQQSRFGSPIQRVLKMFRLIRSSGRGDLNACFGVDASGDLGQPYVFNVRAYLIAKQRMHEVETEKAMILKELRHENWKAGGPV
jgi:hypothetical protein